ncbi:MAG: type II secretion system major pseudopilin GspG [Elusimicrobia bacterium]|nr:type II secretion system major pseudopilin GspG [Elusimicrobiota bacterium]
MNNKGFTLIEIMLVIVIIGILVGVVLPRLTGRSQEARISAAKLQIQTVSLALDAFEADNGRFATNEEGLSALLVKPDNINNWKGPYLKKKVIKDPWGNPYIYVSPGIHNKDYDLKSYGPDGADGGSDDITNWDEKD